MRNQPDSASVFVLLAISWRWLGSTRWSKQQAMTPLSGKCQLADKRLTKPDKQHTAEYIGTLRLTSASLTEWGRLPA